MRDSIPGRRRSTLWSVVALAVYLSSQQPAQPVAYVLDVNGSWHLGGQTVVVKAGEPLYAGAKLSTEWYNYANTITIVRADDLSRTRTECENTPNNPCRRPIVIGSGTSEAPRHHFEALVKTAISLLRDNPPAIAAHYSVTLSRGRYVIIERENIVSLNDAHEFSLTGMMPALPPGKYTVAVRNPDQEQPWSSTTVAEAANGSWQPVPAPAAGLYSISVTDSDGDRRAELLILFVPSAQYEAIKREFDNVKGYASKWQGPNAESDEHVLLRAILLAMSKSS